MQIMQKVLRQKKMQIRSPFLPLLSDFSEQKKKVYMQATVTGEV